MNKDARQDHTMRNALLIIGGTAAIAGGSVAGIKALEKSVKQTAKGATKKVSIDANKVVKEAGKKSSMSQATKAKIEQEAENFANKHSDSIQQNINNQIKKREKETAASIKTNPKNIKTNALSPEEIQAEIKVVKALITKEEILLAQAKQNSDSKKIAECQKMLSDLKQKLAKLGGFAT